MKPASQEASLKDIQNQSEIYKKESQPYVKIQKIIKEGTNTDH